MNKLEKEIDFLKYQQELLKYGLDKYVNNYHHSMMWIATISLGFAAILISLGKSDQIWIAFVFYLAATTMRLVKLKINLDNSKKYLMNFDEAINKRYNKLGLNLKRLKEEVRIK